MNIMVTIWKIQLAKEVRQPQNPVRIPTASAGLSCSSWKGLERMAVPVLRGPAVRKPITAEPSMLEIRSMKTAPPRALTPSLVMQKVQSEPSRHADPARGEAQDLGRSLSHGAAARSSACRMIAHL